MKKETAAGGIVYKKEKGHILWLICIHSHHKGWVFPKGLVGDNNEKELVEDAAVREVKEEGGVKACIIDKLPGTFDYIYTFNKKKIFKIVHYFLMEYITGDPKDHDWEMDDAFFTTEDEVRQKLSYPSERNAFEKAVEILKNQKEQ